MPTLTHAKNGDWFSRKVIPADVRDAYQRAYGVRQEERFRRSDLSPGIAKAEFGQWLADVESRARRCWRPTAYPTAANTTPQTSHIQKGVYAGRPEDTERNEAIMAMLRSRQSWNTILKATGCSRSTLSRLTKRLAEVSAGEVSTA